MRKGARSLRQEEQRFRKLRRGGEEAAINSTVTDSREA